MIDNDGLLIDWRYDRLQSVIDGDELATDGDGLVIDSHGQRYIGARLSIDGDGSVMD